MGKIRTPFYRIVVADARTKRDGRVIEEIGTYNPKTDPSTINVLSERAQYWLSVGAQPTEAVAAILKLTGDIGGNASLKQPEPKADKEAVFQAALKDLHTELPKAKPAPKKDEAKKDEAKKDEAKKDEAKAAPADEAPADEAPAEEAPAEEAAAEEAQSDADEEAAAEEAVAEAPAEEAAAEEAPAEEAPAEEAPTDEAVADESTES
jgi:small subunit ribosomal protein S16